MTFKNQIKRAKHSSGTWSLQMFPIIGLDYSGGRKIRKLMAGFGARIIRDGLGLCKEDLEARRCGGGAGM